MTPTRVLLVSGSLREASVNGAVVRTAAAHAPGDVQARVYRGMADLPAYNPDDDREGAQLPEPVVSLRRELGWADAILFCTPEYAGSLPGSFKNLLDWTVGGGETYGLPVAWINASGPAAPTGGRGAHAALRAVLTWTGAAIVEAGCRRVPVTRGQVGGDGLIADAELRDAITGALSALAVAAREGTASHHSADAAVRAADARFFEALRAADAEALGRLLADAFVIIDVAAGAVHARADFLAAVRDGVVVFESIATDPEQAAVRLFGPFAVVVGSTVMTLAGSGPVHSRYTHVFELDGGEWRLVSAQGTPIRVPAEEPPRASGAPARTQTAAIETDAAVADVLALLADPTVLPRWAPDFADTVTRDGERWRAVKDGRAFSLRAVVREPAGSVDYLREIAPGREGGAYLRVVPRPGGGAVVAMTLPVASGADPRAVRETLRRELAALVACVT